MIEGNAIDEMTSFVCNKVQFMTPPKNCEVVIGSTPVVSFGDFMTARVGTLGINPSSREFLDSANGSLLKPQLKRLADAESLGFWSEDPLDMEAEGSSLSYTDAIEIWEKCRNYFNSPNAYWTWFKDLEKILQTIGFSYKDGSACHLDLSPWATDPVFSGLNKVQQQKLLLGESDFLCWQIAKSSIEKIIFNSIQAYECLQSLDAFGIEKVREISYTSGGAKRKSDLFSGYSPDGTLILGWSLNLQALQATIEEKEDVFNQLGEWLRGH